MNDQLTETIKINAALEVVNTSVLHGINADIFFVKSILPESYTVQESKKKGSIHCKSSIGIRKSPYLNQSTGTVVKDAEDDEHWDYIFKAIVNHFGKRFQEIYHNTCFCHVDFTIYLKPRM
jgi:hypothetical protein